MKAEEIGSKKNPPPNNTGAEIVPMVIADLEGRRVMGEEQYGQVLRVENGRDVLLDLYQELLDAVLYIRQKIAQEDSTLKEAKAEGRREALQEAANLANDPVLSVAASVGGDLEKLPFPCLVILELPPYNFPASFLKPHPYKDSLEHNKHQKHLATPPRALAYRNSHTFLQLQLGHSRNMTKHPRQP